MKILILLIYIQIQGVMTVMPPGLEVKPYNELISVSSPEDASVAIWERNRVTDIWTSYEGKLYEWDFDNGIIKEVPIPKIEFIVKEKAE